MNARLAKCMLVAKVLVADGMMTESEHAFLDATMRRLGLDAEEKRRVVELEGTDEADSVVAALSVEEKRDFVQTLIEAAASDGKLSALEAKEIEGDLHGARTRLAHYAARVT
jgi:uncharacterized tellurite resistance protein B-like protein